MDKGGIIGGVFEEVGEAVKSGTKATVEQVTGTGEFASDKTQAPNEAQLKEMQQREKDETSKKLSEVRAKKSGLQVLEQFERRPEPRHAERVEQQRQEETLEKEKKARNAPPPLQTLSKKGTKERLLGVSG